MSSNTGTASGAAGALIAAAIAAATAGCEATITPAQSPMAVAYEEDGTLVRAEFVPPEIWAYPHVLFGGVYAYLVDGVWYYPTPQGWMVFRREPVELSRQRTRIGAGHRRTPYPAYPGR